MSKYDDRREDREQIRKEAEAEFAFGDLLEQNGLDMDLFLEEQGISQSELNQFIHYHCRLNSVRPASADKLEAIVDTLGNRQKLTKTA
jgi:hypothetical protein